MSAPASLARTVTCPGCQTTYRLPDNVNRPTAPCKRCGKVMSLAPAPAAAGPQAPAKAQKPRPSSSAAEAIHHRSTRAQRALGAAPRRPVSPVHVATGVITLALLVGGIVLFAL